MTGRFEHLLFACEAGGRLHAGEFAEAAHLRFRVAAVLLHHAAHVRVLLQDLVHFLDGGAAAAGDSFAALAVDEAIIGAFGGGHGIDDGFDGGEALFVDFGVFWEIRERADFREHAHELLKRAHLFDLAELIAEIFECEIVFAELAF
jgi:hypothetical protein